VNAQRAIFIGSSSEATGLAAKIASAIAAAGMSPVAWEHGGLPGRADSHRKDRELPP